MNKKQKLKFFNWIISIPLIIIILSTIFFKWWGFIISSLLLFVVEVEIYFYGDILAHTSKLKFDSKDKKHEALFVTFFMFIFSGMIGWVCIELIKQFDYILKQIIIYKNYILGAFGVLGIIILVVCLLCWWYRANKRFAIRELGKNRVK